MKKGDLSMQTIVVAVIVLLVAALLIFLVGRNLGLFGDATGACESRGGTCMSRCVDGMQPFGLGDKECEETGQGNHCCIEASAFFGDNK